MENKEQLLQNTMSNTDETKETPQAEQATKSISATTHEKIVALIQPNILPDTLKITVSTLVEKESIEKPILQDSEKEIVTKTEMDAELDQFDETDIDETDVVVDFSTFNKQQLVELLEETVENKDVTEIKEKVASIKIFFLKRNKEDIDRELEQFITDGGDKESYEHVDDPLETRFKAAFNTYKDNKAKFNEILEKQKQENLEQKKQILEELKELISSEETLKKTYDEFRVLQDKWKEIGQVPVGEITNLWNSYHFLVEKFFDKVKINRELRDLDLKKNLEAKIELCEKAEELLLDTSSAKSFKLLQKLHEQWKEIGPIPHDKKDEVWERFKTATDKINDIRRDHYAKIQEEQMAHYEAKKALCEKIEEIVGEVPSGSSSWQKESDEIIELLKLWKSTGQAPKKLNDEIWTRFKTSMDLFFENKKEFFSKAKEQQLENYNRKLQLCVEAEALQESTDWGKTTTQLRKLQEEWKKIGPVPRRQSEKTWKRFRTACDAFFSRKSAHFLGSKEREEENLAAKNALIERIKVFEVKKERNENLEALKAFQREWVEIGHTPIRQKDAIYAEYRKAIDALFEKMKITENEISTNEYKAMVEGMRENPEARDRMRRERITLSNKIATLRDEIALWENNIGFFANSKQADIMIAEYQKKINRAKNDLKILEQKLKILMN
ncbi:MAG: DUF349 domain-containing protein [Lentimicrobiaceae bacterium]|jgi:hypothetical protein|nr:DUF349 domain-containing protein [Lentimicrobiaceae bacterium]